MVAYRKYIVRGQSFYCLDAMGRSAYGLGLVPISAHRLLPSAQGLQG